MPLSRWLQEDRADRQEHRITAAGREALREWLASPLSGHTDREPFPARLLFASNLTAVEVRGLLAQPRAQTESLRVSTQSVHSVRSCVAVFGQGCSSWAQLSGTAPWGPGTGWSAGWWRGGARAGPW
ncbi:hypothetical protein GCM10009790_39640 [Georgenia ruanii]